MFTNYRYKNLPERQVQEIVTHCLAYSSNSEHNFSTWHVGLTDDLNFPPVGEHFRIISCESSNESADLKRYLTTIRRFQDDGGEGSYIYVYKSQK